jgi:hypothetical protein
VAICAALLLRLRHFRSGEVAAWCGIAVLTIMSIMWRTYSEHLNDPEVLVLAQAAVTYEDGRLGLP